MTTRAVHATVTGQVQGVGFRFATRRVAESLGLDGWVRNLPDGSVEVWAQGDTSAVGEMDRFLNEGPLGSRVRAVQSTDRSVDPQIAGFEIRY